MGVAIQHHAGEEEAVVERRPIAPHVEGAVVLEAQPDLPAELEDRPEEIAEDLRPALEQIEEIVGDLRARRT